MQFLHSDTAFQGSDIIGVCMKIVVESIAMKVELTNRRFHSYLVNDKVESDEKICIIAAHTKFCSTEHFQMNLFSIEPIY